MEPVAAILMTAAMVSLCGSWLLLLFKSANEDFTWGLCTLFLPPLSYLYCLWRLEETKDALALAVAGVLMAGLSLAVA